MKNTEIISLKSTLSSVFEALILVAVLSDRMNVVITKHVDLSIPIYGVIQIHGKAIRYYVINTSGDVRHAN
jgi:hypothetical protein